MVNVQIVERLPGELMDGNDMGVPLNVVHGAGSFRILYQIAVIILCLLDLAFTGPLQLAYDLAGQLRLEINTEFCVNPFASDVQSSVNGHFQSMILKTIREMLTFLQSAHI
jgi:hypothetical protein